MISDLHIGGEPPSPREINGQSGGSRINSSYDALAEFVLWIAEAKEPTELVLNGDIVDFLLDYADDPASSFTSNPQTAADRLDRIAADCPVFDAWGKLVRTRRHQLTVLIGNHDIEMSFPMVRQRFADLLRVPLPWVNFVLDGEALIRGRLMIEHGNRYDPWNWVDHDRLRHERSLQSRYLESDSLNSRDRFEPPNGSRLVIEVMNELKTRYRFVDLLKPENAAALPLLFGLLGNLQRLQGFCRALPRAIGFQWDRFSKKDNFGHPADPHYIGADNPTLEDELRQIMGEKFGTLEWSSEDAFEVAAGDGIKRWVGKHVMNLAPKNIENGLLAWFCRRGDSRHFSIDYEEESYVEAVTALVKSNQIDVVVLGHTHLPKSLKLSPRGHYFNSGTWVEVMKLKQQETETAEAMEGVVQDLLANKLGKYLHSYRSFVEVNLSDSGLILDANLFRYDGRHNPRGSLA